MENVISHLICQTENITKKSAPKVEKVASRQEIEEAEGILGFAIPELIKQIFLRIGNGGWALGPGYGLLGLNRLTGDLGDSNMINESLEFRKIPCFDGWPNILVLCDWGCSSLSCADCSDSDVPVYRYNGELILESYNKDEPSVDLWDIESDTLEEWFLDNKNIHWCK